MDLKILETSLKSDAGKGDLEAQANLAMFYFQGESVGGMNNYDKAFKWANIAAKKGNALAQAILGNLYKDGLGCKKNKDKATHWFTKSSEQNHTLGLAGLMSMLGDRITYI